MSPSQISYSQEHAAVLVWQTVYRVVVATGAAIILAALFAFGYLDIANVAESALGGRLLPWVALLPLVAYLLVLLTMRYAVEHKSLSRQAVAAVIVLADATIAFWVVFVLSQPEHYERALLIALFSLQVTQANFTRRLAFLVVLLISSAYLLLHDIAGRCGVVVQWPAVVTTTLLFSVGAAVVINVHGNLHRRLSSLVSIFRRAEDGDFSHEYDISGDSRPDAVTMVGRAYNRMRLQLATTVLTDPLSGCLNRRGFEQQYRREVARATRSSGQLSLLAIDLDHFKQVNDKYGHIAGDRVIAETGELLLTTARAGDVVARTGGEEFVVIAPDTDSQGAVQLASRIIEAFRKREFLSDRKTHIKVTASVGVVSASVSSEGVAEELRARADEALYSAKRSGRDRVVVSALEAEQAD